MKNDNDKWLESLRESLDGFEVEPRPGIWDSIERDAAAARRRPTLTVVWRAVAAAACLALVVGAYFLMSNPDNGNVAPRVSPVITKTETSATPASAGIVTPAELIADSHDHTSRPHAEAVMAMTDDAPLVSIDEEPVCTVAPADSVEDRPRATTREFLEAMPAASTAVSHRSAANTPTAKRIDNGNRRWHIALAANNAFGQGSSASEGGFSPLYHIPAHSHMLSVGTSTFDATYLKATTNNIDEATATDDIVSFPVSYSASFRYMLTDHWGINAGISYAYATSERRSGSESDYYSSKIRMHYIGIPVTVSYTFLSSRYVSLYALAGGQVEKCVKTTRKDFVVASGQEQKQATRHNTLDSHPWQGSVNAGVGAQLNITDRYGIFAEPQLVYDLSDDSASPVHRRNDFSFQLAVGLRLSY